MAKDTFSQSLWSATSPAALPLPELQGELSADVAVIGAGFLGMNTALCLAERGINVVLVEAREPGFGASGRNTGFVVPTLKKALSPAQIEVKFGAARGGAFNQMIGASGKTLFDRLHRYGIPDQAEQTGWMQPAHSRAALKGCQLQAQEWRERGFAVEVLDQAETAARTGLRGYHGALYIPSGGQVNPLTYARNLARVLASINVPIYVKSPVSQIERQGDGWQLRTPKGMVLAKKVIACTNAMAGQLLPAVTASFIPAGSWQIATQRLSPELQARILPGRFPIADTRRHLFAARWSPDGRIVGGGLCYPGPLRAWRARQRFTKRFQAFLPELGPLKAEYVWTGQVSMLTDALPRLYEMGPNFFAPLGCNGRGVALTAAYGTELARLLAEEVSAKDFVVPLTRPEPIPMRRFAGLAPYLWLPYSELQDRRETEIAK